jgi:two-component system CheB/CheR fusion protein
MPAVNPEIVPSRVFETVLSAITDFAYAFDLQGRFIYMNQALLDLWGLQLEEALGKNFFELKYPHDLAAKLQNQIQRVIDTGKSLTDETPYTSPGGMDGFYEYIFTPIFAVDGKVDGVAGTTRDVTGRKRIEQELREARDAAEAGSQAKDRFLAVLSHELRTPLSPVVMTVAAMEMHPDLPYDLREDVAMIRRNIDLETKLIDDLLDLSRVTSGKLRLQMQPAHLHELLRHTFEVCASDLNGKRLSVRFELNATNDIVAGDPARLQQVFWNLMKNAIKFSTTGGEIRVRTANIGAHRIQVEMSDRGVGIRPEILPRIFDAFEQGGTSTTREFGGLGLGLAISKALIDMHGGTISASSGGVGAGATFTIGLDITSPTEPGIASTKMCQGVGGASGSPRVLLVEDHPDTAKTLARLLSLQGYTTRVANSVAVALQLAAGESFDIVVSDIGLPDASGYELMEQLKSRYEMKGVALSGYGMEEDVRRGRDAGFDDHVVKPVNVAQLDAVIRRVLGRSAHEG